MEDKKFYVYAHRDPRDNSTRYIGKGCGDRAYRLNCRVSKHGSWINSLKNKGLLPIVEILEWFTIESDALAKEKELIEFFLKNEPKFCNMLTGGTGVGSGASHPMFGRKHSEKTKEQMSNSHKAIKKTEEWKRNIGLAHKGRPKSPESIAKRVAKMSKKVICIENNTVYDSASIASKILDIDRSSIIRICKGKQKQSWNKFTFIYFT